MKPDTGERELVFKLLQENSTVGQVAQYLKGKGLHYSAGSWDELFDKRVAKALEEKGLTREDLVDLIRLSEEHGNQHVFLYKATDGRATSLIDKNKVESALGRVALSSLMGHPRVLDQPSSPTIVDVRLEADGNRQALVTKVVECRAYQKFVDQQSDGDFLIRRYRELRIRAVNLFRLGSDGLLELRIYTHENSSDYNGDVSKMWNLLSFLFSPGHFRELSLGKKKTDFWKNRTSLAKVLRYSDSTLRNTLGTVLTAATGEIQLSLIDDPGASNGLDQFLKYKGGYCDASNIWWLRGGGQLSKSEFDMVPSRDVHVLLRGKVNEFVVPAKCSKRDYEYVLDKLR
jgi:hypothetical protein